jgi:hypothetical protein
MIRSINGSVLRHAPKGGDIAREGMRMHRFALNQARSAEGSTFPRRGAVQQHNLRATALQMQCN